MHANFLAGMLPSLDGTEFDWSGAGENIVSVLVAILILVGAIVLIKKYKPDRAANILNYVNLAVIAMLLVSLVTTIATTDVLKTKEVSTVASTKNINLVSTEKNYFVLMLDAIDAKTFEDVLKEDGAEELKDFSFFPDSLAGYPFTRDSIPFIFSGIWNENEKSFAEYSTEAFDNTKFFTALSKSEYTKKNFYDYEFTWRSRKAFEFDNIESMDKTYRTKHFIFQEVKYLLFKTLPYPLKRFSKIDQMNFSLSRVDTAYEPFIWDDINYYHETLKNAAEKTDEKVIKAKNNPCKTEDSPQQAEQDNESCYRRLSGIRAYTGLDYSDNRSLLLGFRPCREQLLRRLAVHLELQFELIPQLLLHGKGAVAYDPLM